MSWHYKSDEDLEIFTFGILSLANERDFCVCHKFGTHVALLHYGKSSLSFSYFTIYYTILSYHTLPILPSDNYYGNMRVWDEQHCGI